MKWLVIFAIKKFKGEINKMIIIRNEKENEYKLVEEIIRKSFYNQYVLGCFEHYLAHIIRSHEDFIHELDFVAEIDGKVVGNIMYTKAKLIDEKGEEKTILTFGPLCVLPEFQRKGIGKMLMEHSFEEVVELGYDVIVIFGSPSNYVGSGFKSCKKYNISVEGGKFPTAMIVKELKENVLDGRKWTYYDSPAMHIDLEEAELYDASLPKMEKKFTPSQEEFFILSNSFLD